MYLFVFLLFSIFSLVQSLNCQENAALVDSVYGRLCDECNGKGYLTPENKCECYSRELDPFINCQGAPQAEVNITVNYTKVTCSCYFDEVNGYFAPITAEHKFGTANPPVCDTCISPAYGPKPGSNAIGAATLPCTLWGGPDPNSGADKSWRPCSNHGQWYNNQCNCDLGWRLVASPEKGKNDTEVVYTCGDCSANYGPKLSDITDLVFLLKNPFCSKVWVLGKECGGNGVYEHGKCNCFNGEPPVAFQDVFTCI